VHQEGSWASIDLGEARSLIPNYYCIRHGNDSGRSRLQSWNFEGSNDGSSSWAVKAHKNDNSLPNQGFSVAAWEVKGVNQAYRHFRIRMTGKDAYGYHYLYCAGIELYGVLH
jgi:hypothetical protein